MVESRPISPGGQPTNGIITIPEVLPKEQALQPETPALERQAHRTYDTEGQESLLSGQPEDCGRQRLTLQIFIYLLL